MICHKTEFRYAVRLAAIMVLGWCHYAFADNELVREYLKSRVEQTGFSGAILIQKNSATEIRHAYGFADRELGIRLTPSHIFRIGSLTKPFTATAILLLAERNRLDLDNSVCTFVDECPEAWQGVSIRDLLGHTSGIPDYFGHLEAVPVEATVAEVNALLGDLDAPGLQSEPGSQYAYSNFNYVLLGYAIERFSRRSWEQFLIDEMFGPLEMDDTRYDDVWSIVHGRARGYSISDDQVVNIEYDDHAAYAAGGLRSTLADLETWHSAYIGNEIIGAGYRELATTPGPGDYGLGWQSLTMFGRAMYNHTGGIDGFTSHLAYYPADQLLVIVLSNSDQEDAKATACDLAALVFKTEPLPTGDSAWMGVPRDERCREMAAE